MVWKPSSFRQWLQMSNIPFAFLINKQKNKFLIHKNIFSIRFLGHIVLLQMDQNTQELSISIEVNLCVFFQVVNKLCHLIKYIFHCGHRWLLFIHVSRILSWITNYAFVCGIGHLGKMLFLCCFASFSNQIYNGKKLNGLLESKHTTS